MRAVSSASGLAEGPEAASAVADGDFGSMIAYRCGEMVRVPIVDLDAMAATAAAAFFTATFGFCAKQKTLSCLDLQI